MNFKDKKYFHRNTYIHLLSIVKEEFSCLRDMFYLSISIRTSFKLKPRDLIL